MAKYNARNFSQWEGKTFELTDGRSYTVTTQRERKVIGPSVIKHLGEYIYLPLFIGSPPDNMSYDELVARGKATIDRLSVSGGEIFETINASSDRAKNLPEHLRDPETLEPESRRRSMTIEYKLTCPKGNGIYEILERPKPGRILVIGLNLRNAQTGESRNRILAPEERIARIIPTKLRLVE